MIAQGLPALGGAIVGSLPSVFELLPDATVSSTSWSAVGAATLHEALATGDTDYMTASTAGAVAEIGLSNPAAPLTLTDVSFRIRARLS